MALAVFLWKWQKQKKRVTPFLTVVRPPALLNESYRKGYLTLCPFVQFLSFFFNSLELALQVHVTFNVALNWIPISSKHFFPKGFPTEVFAGQRSLSNTVFKRLFRKTGLYPPIRMSRTGCEEWDSHAGGNGTLLDSLSDLQVAECRHARCLRSLRAPDPCAGLCRERLLSYFLTQIFPNLQMKVSEPRPFLELSHWLGCPQGYAHRDSSCSQLRLWQWQPSLSPILPPFSTQGFFSFLSVFFFLFAKQPCERDKIILKSILWWEFWQWVEDGNYSSIRLSGFGQISCVESGDQGMGSWIVFHCCHGDSDAGGL